MSYMGKVAQSKRQRLPLRDVPPRVEIQGELLQFKCGTAYTPPPVREKGTRIVGFSPSARLRLTKTLLTIDYEKTPVSVVICLTYPPLRCPRNKDQRAQDLTLFLRYVNKHLGRQPYGVWRTEWVVRKSGVDKGNCVPHIHLLLFNVVFIRKELVNLWWRRILRYKRYCRTEIKRARDKAATLYYLAKYVTKRGEASLVYAPNYDTIDGKHYGYVRPKSIPRCETEDLTGVTQEQIDYLFQKHHEHFGKSDTRPGESFSIMGRHVTEIAEECKRIGRDGRVVEEIVLDDGEVIE